MESEDRTPFGPEEVEEIMKALVRAMYEKKKRDLDREKEEKSDQEAA